MIEKQIEIRAGTTLFLLFVGVSLRITQINPEEKRYEFGQ